MITRTYCLLTFTNQRQRVLCFTTPWREFEITPQMKTMICTDTDGRVMVALEHVVTIDTREWRDTDTTGWVKP
jgi:hypothetical protein